jgi:hypothetical protein
MPASACVLRYSNWAAAPQSHCLLKLLRRIRMITYFGADSSALFRRLKLATNQRSELPDTMTNRTVWLSVLIGCLVTPLLYLLAAFYSGGGHSLTSMIIAFPYGMLWGLMLKGLGEWPGLILMVVQYPIYGLVIGIARARKRSLRYALALLVLHALLVALTFKISSRV